jgi:glutamyl-tRNA reductase
MPHEIVIVGLNHRTATVDVREQLAFAGEQLDVANRTVTGLAGVEEAAVVCTCNRVEVVVSTPEGDEAVSGITQFLRTAASEPGEQLAAALYTFRGRAAVRHLFRVASSLDSMVVGEPQILGQLKEFYTRASTVGATGTILHRCFHKAFSVAKRVRTETGIASRAVSVSSAAVELASKIFDRLEDKTAMLIGAGKMGELAARHLLAHGVSGMLVSNRTFDRAVELAREFRATPVPFEQFPRYLQMSDIVIAATGATEYILGPVQVHDALRERKGRPMFCIDLAVPRNLDPRIGDLANVYLYDVDDLSGVAEENLGERAQEAAKAEAIVDEEVDKFWRWLEHLEVVPTIVALRERAEAIRLRELEKTFGTLRDISAREREAIEALSAAIVNKLLHTPVTRLKEPNHRREAFYVDAVRRLFDLEEPDES